MNLGLINSDFLINTINKNTIVQKDFVAQHSRHSGEFHHRKLRIRKTFDISDLFYRNLDVFELDFFVAICCVSCQNVVPRIRFFDIDF